LGIIPGGVLPVIGVGRLVKPLTVGGFFRVELLIYQRVIIIILSIIVMNIVTK
jgi:hypothetical protein